MTARDYVIKGMAKSRVRAPLKLVVLLALAWGAVFIGFSLASDKVIPTARIASDFHTSFYVAGYLVSHGQASSLYPAPPNDQFIGAAFDRTTHRLLKGIPDTLVGIFMYCPLVAVLFAPFAGLSPNDSLACFDLICVFALFASALAIEQSGVGVASHYLALCFLFFPVEAAIWIGQLGIVFGMMPLAIGCLCLLTGRLFLCGVVWSLIFLKLQLFPAVALATVCLALSGAWRPLLGLVLGTVALTTCSVACLGAPVFLSWLFSLKISETVLSGVNLQGPPYLVACLSGAIFNQIPAQSRLGLRPAVYSVILLLLLGLLVVLFKLARSALSKEQKYKWLVALSVLCLPIVSPHLLLYDLVICLVPFVLLWKYCSLNVKRAIVLYFIFVDVYTTLIVVGIRCNPLCLIAGHLILFALLVRSAVRLVDEQGSTAA